METPTTTMKEKLQKMINKKNGEKIIMILCLMILFSDDAMAGQSETAIRKILVPAVSGVFSLIIIAAGFKAASKFSNQEPKEGMGYIGGIVASIIIWTLVVKNADALTALLPQA